MQKQLRVLLAGESWITHEFHIKGADSFTISGYGEGIRWLKRAVESSGGVLDHIPNHVALEHFPASEEALQPYDVVVLSDIGANTLLFHPATTTQSLPTPNRLRALEQYVANGGALVMVGGYMTFSGINGKAAYHGTAVEDALPVRIRDGIDDRVEVPEGFQPVVRDADHPITQGIPKRLPTMLFYNAVTAKEDSSTLITAPNGDPILTIWKYGRGRSAAFTPDIAPHGATADFLDWPLFDQFWTQIFTWLTGADS